MTWPEAIFGSVSSVDQAPSMILHPQRVRLWRQETVLIGDGEIVEWRKAPLVGPTQSHLPWPTIRVDDVDYECHPASRLIWTALPEPIETTPRGIGDDEGYV